MTLIVTSVQIMRQEIVNMALRSTLSLAREGYFSFRYELVAPSEGIYILNIHILKARRSGSCHLVSRAQSMNFSLRWKFNAGNRFLSIPTIEM